MYTIYVYVCVYIYIYIYIYTHTHAHTQTYKLCKYINMHIPVLIYRIIDQVIVACVQSTFSPMLLV